jgi:hypothetical protein
MKQRGVYMKKYLFYLAIIGLPFGLMGFVALLIYFGKIIYG